MIKRYFVHPAFLLLFFLSATPIFGQQKPVISQYMFNGLVLNPAYTGVNGYLSATAVYRDQWVNLEGAPTTTTLSVHSGIKGKNIGLGMMAISDQIGVHSDNAIYFTYAYKIKMSHGTLSMGLQAGFNNLASNFNELNLKDEVDPLLNGMISDLKMNFGTGIYYNSNTAYIGFSIPYLRKKRRLREYTTVRDLEESRYYYLTAGKVMDLTHRVKIKPSVLLRIEEGMPLAGDANLNLYIDDLVNVGLSYRSGDSFATLFELKVTDYIRIGYSYDWVISDLTQYTNGTHEFMLNYRINLFAPRKHRMCPGPNYF